MLATSLMATSVFCFCALAFPGTRLLMNNLAWRVDNRDWRFWLFVSHLCSILLMDVAEVPSSAPYAVLMVVNSVSCCPFFTQIFTQLQYVGRRVVCDAVPTGSWLIFCLCMLMQLVLWSLKLYRS